MASLKARGVDIEFAFPEEGAITFITTLHIVKGAENVENAYAYIDAALSAEVQAQLMKPPSSMIPTNKDVVLRRPAHQQSGRAVQDEDARLEQDQSLRAGWIERFNKEVAK